MFSDPQSITVSGAAKSLPRISTGDMSGRFRSADGSYALSIEHKSQKGRDRSVVRINTRKIGANPLDPSKNVPYTAAGYLVLNSPSETAGFTNTELEDLVKALTAYLSAANVTKFVGKES